MQKGKRRGRRIGFVQSAASSLQRATTKSTSQLRDGCKSAIVAPIERQELWTARLQHITASGGTISRPCQSPQAFAKRRGGIGAAAEIRASLASWKFDLRVQSSKIASQDKTVLRSIIISRTLQELSDCFTWRLMARSPCCSRLSVLDKTRTLSVHSTNVVGLLYRVMWRAINCSTRKGHHSDDTLLERRLLCLVPWSAPEVLVIARGHQSSHNSDINRYLTTRRTAVASKCRCSVTAVEARATVKVSESCCDS